MEGWYASTSAEAPASRVPVTGPNAEILRCRRISHHRPRSSAWTGELRYGIRGFRASAPEVISIERSMRCIRLCDDVPGCCKRSPLLFTADIAKHKNPANITPSAAAAAPRCLLHPPPLVDSGPDLSGPFFFQRPSRVRRAAMHRCSFVAARHQGIRASGHQGIRASGHQGIEAARKGGQGGGGRGACCSAGKSSAT